MMIDRHGVALEGQSFQSRDHLRVFRMFCIIVATSSVHISHDEHGSHTRPFNNQNWVESEPNAKQVPRPRL